MFKTHVTYEHYEQYTNIKSQIRVRNINTIKK